MNATTKNAEKTRLCVDNNTRNGVCFFGFFLGTQLVRPWKVSTKCKCLIISSVMSFHRWIKVLSKIRSSIYTSNFTKKEVDFLFNRDSSKSSVNKNQSPHLLLQEQSVFFI